jgi:filamentous hemagglutinin family protein
MRAWALFFAPLPLFCLPQGLTVAAGDATAHGSAQELQITTSDRAILQWESFSIALGETARFVQPSAQAAVLNQVTGSDLSRIDGLLQSNGRVYLVNPQGIVIGPQGRIDTAGFLATALEIRPEEFVHAQTLQLQGESFAPVVNLGTIECRDGSVSLIGHTVDNSGSIVAGDASLVAAHHILIHRDAMPLIAVHPAMPVTNDLSATADWLQTEIDTNGIGSLAINLDGTIEALALHEDGGRIYLLSPEGAVSVAGTVRADREICIDGERVVVPGSLSGEAARVSGSTLAMAGTCAVDDAEWIAAPADSRGRWGRASLPSTFDCSEHRNSIEISGAMEIGHSLLVCCEGDIHLSGTIQGTEIIADFFGDRVFVETGAELYTPMSHLRIGGSDRGQDPAIPHAIWSRVSPGALIHIGGEGARDGGSLVLWGTKAVQFEGEIQGRSGPDGGYGGFVEVSSHGYFSCRGPIDLNGVAGNGILLWDPVTLTISSAATSGATIGDPTTFSANTVTINNTDLQNYLQGTGNVSIDATSGAQTGNGTITWSASANVTWTSNNSLSLRGQTISIASNISTTSTAPTTVSIIANGAISISENITVTGSAGNNGIYIESLGTASGSYTGVSISKLFMMNNDIESSSGNITIIGRGGPSSGSGISMSCDITTTTGNISLTGIGGGTGMPSIAASTGINLSYGTITTSSGSITLNGTATAGAGSAGCFGIGGGFTSITSTGAGAGDISLVGQGAVGGADTNAGISFSAMSISATDADVSIIGYGGGSDQDGTGIQASSSTITLSNASSLIMQGIGATSSAGGAGSSSATSQNRGIFLTSCTISSNSGSIALTGEGKGTASQNSGIYVAISNSISSTSGNITLTGTGSSAGSGTGNSGIHFDNLNNSATLSTGGSGTLTLNGTAGSGTLSYGIDIETQVTTPFALSTTVNGNTLYRGTGSSSGTALLISSGSGPRTTGSGTLTLEAIGGSLQIGESGSANSTAIATTGSGALSLSASSGNIILGNATGQSVSLACNGAGNLSVSSGQSLQIANASISSASTGTMTFQAGTNISLGDTVTIAGTSGSILMLGGVNVTASGTGSLQTTGPSATITIVADNNNATPFQIGSGRLSFPSTYTFSSSKVNFFAGPPGTSSFPSTINGLAYTPGFFSGSTYTPGTHELLGYWYPSLLPPSLPTFQISYKLYSQPPPQTVVTEVTVATTQATVVPTQVNTTTLSTIMNYGTANQNPQNTCTAPSVSVGI